MNKQANITTRIFGDGTGKNLFIVMFQDTDQNAEFSKTEVWQGHTKFHVGNMIMKRRFQEDPKKPETGIYSFDWYLRSGYIQIKPLGKLT